MRRARKPLAAQDEEVVAATRAWLERAVAAFPDASQIFQRNIETLRRLGHAGWRRLEAGKP